jgi:predicted dehydrogenase
MGTTATVGVGVIGRGFGRRVVAPVFAATEGCEVVDVVSPRDEEAWRALLARDDVDVVAVHSPPFCHRELVVAAVEAGKAVLCDKPFGCNEDDALAMEAAARDAGAVALLNFEFRHHPGRARLRELVQEGVVGTVEHVQWSAFAAGSRIPLRWYGWLFDASRGGGWIGAWGSHAIDFLRWTFGDLTDAGAHTRVTVTERPDRDGNRFECTAEDAFTAWMRTAGGASVTIDTSFVTPAPVPTRITVLGSDGVLESVGDQRITLRTHEGSTQVFAFDAPVEDPHLVPMRAWAEVVRDAVRAGKVPAGEPTFRDGVECARVMDRLRA